MFQQRSCRGRTPLHRQQAYLTPAADLGQRSEFVAADDKVQSRCAGIGIADTQQVLHTSHPTVHEAQKAYDMFLAGQCARHTSM